ncbi:hypothetical protein CDAR_49021 [Caerostris darwini]|uniref:Uncharacterized protein n=1 Tax=Caerostris darwini TaxID=1538125 RepID=A0AAV4NJ07_9ARAC|nr:hypothetical protein CDAR_49021 [Caerostris darwini]
MKEKNVRKLSTHHSAIHIRYICISATHTESFMLHRPQTPDHSPKHEQRISGARDSMERAALNGGRFIHHRDQQMLPRENADMKKEKLFTHHSAIQIRYICISAAHQNFRVPSHTNIPPLHRNMNREFLVHRDSIERAALNRGCGWSPFIIATNKCFGGKTRR